MVVLGFRIHCFESENVIYIRYVYVWMAIKLFELFNASIEDNTLFGEGAIVRVYSNKIMCARAPRRVTNQYVNAYYMRARSTGLMY